MSVDAIAWKNVSCTSVGRSRATTGIPGVTKTSYFNCDSLVWSKATASYPTAASTVTASAFPNFPFGRSPFQLVRQLLPICRERQRHRVDAIAIARRRRAVREDMALVRAAAGANDLGPHHAIAGIANLSQIPVGERSRETGPARAALELGASPEQGQPTHATRVYTRPLLREEE